MKIERKSDGRLTDLSLRQIERSKLESFNYRLINGGTDSYRMLYIKRNQRIRYEENLLLLPNPYPEEFFRKTNNDLQIIDLGANNNQSQGMISLSVYPNPAQDKLFLTGSLPSGITSDIENKDKRITIIVFNLLGLEISKMSIIQV